MTEFDHYGQDYRQLLERSIEGLGSVESAVDSKLKVIESILAAHPISSSGRALDFGCGTGLLTDSLQRFAVRSFGVDVSIASLKRSSAQESHLALFDGQDLPFQDNSFDLVVASCVFHHIRPEARRGIVLEIRRVLSQAGIFVLIEHNPYNPVTRFVVNRCEFDRDARLLSLFAARTLLLEAQFHPFRDGHFYAVPPVNRALCAVDSALSRLPLGAQYYCAVSKTELGLP